MSDDIAEARELAHWAGIRRLKPDTAECLALLIAEVRRQCRVDLGERREAAASVEHHRQEIVSECKAHRVG